MDTARRCTGVPHALVAAAVAVLACTVPQEPTGSGLTVQPDAVELAVGETATIDVTTDWTDPPELTFRCHIDGFLTPHALQAPEGCAVTAAGVGTHGTTRQYSVTAVQPGTALLYFRIFGEGLCLDPAICGPRERELLDSEIATVIVR